MMPFITRRRHDAEMAKVRKEEQGKWYKLATRIENERDELRTRCHTLQSRLDALTPARGQGELAERERNILRSLGEGARTFQIAKRMGWETPTARRLLYRMERAGLIQRDTKHSAVNDVRWLPTPPETTV